MPHLVGTTYVVEDNGDTNPLLLVTTPVVKYSTVTLTHDQISDISTPKTIIPATENLNYTNWPTTLLLPILINMRAHIITPYTFSPGSYFQLWAGENDVAMNWFGGGQPVDETGAALTTTSIIQILAGVSLIVNSPTILNDNGVVLGLQGEITGGGDPANYISITTQYYKITIP